MIPVLTAVVLGCVLVAGLGQMAQAQAQGAYPNVDRPFALGPGDTIQLLNRIVVDRAPGQRGTRLDVHYSTRIPASDAAARAEQADRVAHLMGAEASKLGVRKVMVSICETRACAETREPAKLWYAYERGIGGVWSRRP
jgi:hypothetical protein